MFKKVFSILVGSLLISIIFSFNISADEIDDINVGVFGASLLTGLRQAGGVIINNKNETVYNISYTFSVIGINDEFIDYVDYGFKDELGVNSAFLFSTKFVNGFGPVIISLNASLSNGFYIQESTNGFQLGPFTFSKPYVLAWF